MRFDGHLHVRHGRPFRTFLLIIRAVATARIVKPFLWPLTRVSAWADAVSTDGYRIPFASKRWRRRHRQTVRVEFHDGRAACAFGLTVVVPLAFVERGRRERRSFLLSRF